MINNPLPAFDKAIRYKFLLGKVYRKEEINIKDPICRILIIFKYY